jgi:hypothetical protein
MTPRIASVDAQFTRDLRTLSEILLRAEFAAAKAKMNRTPSAQPGAPAKDPTETTSSLETL